MLISFILLYRVRYGTRQSPAELMHLVFLAYRGYFSLFQQHQPARLTTAEITPYVLLLLTMAEESIDTLPPYEYQPLPDSSHIRLLRRQGPIAPDDGILRFSLETRSLDDEETRYHCLSYTWGNPFAHGVGFKQHFDAVDAEYTPSRSVPIVVDGQLMRIQRNLHDALSVVERENAYRRNLNTPSRIKGRVSMHRVAETGREEYIRLWARRGADVNVADEDGRIALHEAAVNGHVGCVELLCLAGSRRAVEDKDGKTPEDLAEAAGHTEVVQLLRELSSQPDPEASSISPEENGPEHLIWADAICINQGDIVEKGQQVSMMDRIYSHSSYVVAWLGPEDEHTAAGLRAFRTLRRHTDALKESSIVPYDGNDKESYEAAGVPLVPRGEWDGLASIYQRQWFRRAWIAQEAILPDVLLMYIGSDQIGYHDLGTIAMTLGQLYGKLNHGFSSSYVPGGEIAVSVEWNMAELFKSRDSLYFSRTSATEDERRAYRERFQLHRLIYNLETFLASDPRDKIFSLYGIINEIAEEKMVADYRQSVFTVFTTATRRIIMQSGGLSIINAWTNMAKRRPGLPSWVPDFELFTGNQVPDYEADKGLGYRAPRSDALDCPYLGLRGLFVGRISRVGGRVSTAPAGKFRFDPSWLSMVLSLRESAEDNTVDEGTVNETTISEDNNANEDGSEAAKIKPKINLTEILWRTLCMDASPSMFSAGAEQGQRAPDEFGLQFYMFMQLMIFAGADEKLLQAVGLEPSRERDLFTIIHLDHDPLQDMTSVLDDLDALLEHDGEDCFTPPRSSIEKYYGHLQHTLIRNSPGKDDGSMLEFNVPPSVSEGTDRLVGRGIVARNSRFFQRCREFAIAFDGAMGHRQLVIVDGKRLGVAGLLVEDGDEIWIIPGIRAPVVLRKMQPDVASESKAPRYSFLGKAYVHGIMDGEASLGREDELQDIELG